MKVREMKQRRIPANVADVQALAARVVELEAELAALREQHAALETLADRIVVFLKHTHGDAGQPFRLVEEAAEEAISVR
jgi:hypothetical protein